MKLPLGRGTQVCSGDLGHITNMSATPISGKNPSKIFSRTSVPFYGKVKRRKMLVLFLFCTVIWKAVDFKRSKSFGDLAKRSLGLNISKSETNRQMTITFKLADNQHRHKLSDEFEI